MIAVLLCSLHVSSVTVAQSSARWFQIEVSIFTNENPADRESEYWTPGSTPLSFPRTLQRLQNLLDLLVIDELLIRDTFVPGQALQEPVLPPPVQTVDAAIRATGPYPAVTEHSFRFYDFARDPFILLPVASSNFQQTNRAIERAPEHRMLYHALWRQPGLSTADAIPILVSGGEEYGGTAELQGSLTLRMNANSDRIVLDADLWLTEFSIVADDNMNWELPAVPTRLREPYAPSVSESALDYRIRRIYQLTQSREMRSAEFHYLDHPAFGLVITVEPYEVPAYAEPTSAELETVDSLLTQ